VRSATRTDVIYSGHLDSVFSVLRGRGNGTFEAESTFAVSHYGSIDCVTGDFDGDGLPDLALARSVGWGVGDTAVFLNRSH
jgi:hypothetical protein